MFVEFLNFGEGRPPLLPFFQVLAEAEVADFDVSLGV